MAQVVVLTSIIVILVSLAGIKAAPQFGGGSFASSQAGSFGGGGGGFGYPGQYPGFGYQRPGFGYPGGHFGGGGLSRVLAAYALAKAAGGGYPGHYGGYPGQFGGYPGQFGGYPGQYGPGFGGPSPGLSLSKSVSIGAGGISGSFAASAGK